MTDAELITAIKTANDTAISNAVDITTDNAAAITGALTGADGTVYADVAAAVAAGVTSVDITSDNATAATTALRNAAAELGVSGTSVMTDAELITAIKTANDTAIANGVDLTTDNVSAINSAVAAATTFTNLDDLVEAYEAAISPAEVLNYVLAATADVISGGASATVISGTAGTIDGDNINGGGGADTLNLTVTVADDDNSAFTATSVETISIRSTGGTANDAAFVDLNFADVTGMETLQLRRLGDDVEIDDLGDLTATIELNNIATAADVNINYDAATVAGASDTVNVTIASSTGGGDLVINDVETIAVTVTGEDNDMNIDGDSIDSVTIAGAGDLNVDFDASVTTANASSNTGGVTMNATAAADVTFTGGTGADTFAMGATLTAADTLAGGDGADTLAVTGAGGALIPASASVTNVETLTATINGVDTLDANIVAFDNINVLSTAATDDITITDLTDEVLTLTQTAAGNDIDEVDVSLADATGSADSLTVNVTNAHTTTVFNVDLIESTGGGIETLTVNLNQGVDLAAADDIQVDVITAGTALTITGDADAELGAGTALTQTVVNAATATGDLTINVGAAASAVTGGSGADTFAFAGGLTTTDTITGGLGADELSETLAAGTSVAATMSGVETLSLAFANATSTFVATNASGVETVSLTGDEAVRITNLSESVTAINLAATDADGGETATITHSGSASALTMTIGDTVDGTAGDDVDMDAVSTTYAGALTLVSGGDDGNSINGFDANSATSIVITAEKDTDITGGGDDDVSATSATTASITTAGGDFVIDDDLILDDATSVTLTAADGAITVTDDLDVSVADGSVTLVASGGDANDITVGNIAFEDMVNVSATATGGADITITDMDAFTGTDSDGDDITTTMTLSSTGSGSVVTVSDLGFGGAATLDTVTITTASDGVVSFTVTDDDTTITTINASGAAADDLVIDVNDLAAATTITLGAGDDASVTLSDNGDTVTTGSGTSTIIVTDGQADITFGSAVDTVSFQQVNDDVQITNFTAGTGGDVVQIDISAFTALTNGGSTTVADWFTPVIEDFATTDALSAADDGTNIIRITDNVANSAAMEAVLEDDILDDGNFTAGDDIVVLWTDGADTYISEVDITTLDTGVDGVDAVAATTVATLVGVTIGDLVASNFDFIA